MEHKCDHHLLLLPPPFRSPEVSRQAHFDLSLSILPLTLGSAVQAQSFQPERDSFQDQSSPPQSLPEALLAKPMHPLQPL